jgi:bacteriorhodopsin
VKFNLLHTRMTEIVAQALSDGTPIAVSLTNTLNEVTSNQASRLAAYRDRRPASILFLLFACSILTVLLIGREQGAANNSEIVGTLCFIFLVSLAVYVTLDLNISEGGWVRVSQEPIERLLSSMSR